MYKKTVRISNQSGLHARPASDFIALAGQFQSDIWIRNVEKNEAPITAKSILLLLAKGYSQGETVELSAEGSDEQAAVEQLVDLIESGFGEC